jgi:hypothetical protein
MSEDAKIKKPVICAFLCFIFSSFGFLYLGGWFFLFSIIALSIKIFITIFLIDLKLPDWFLWIQSIAMAWHGYVICKARNEMIQEGITNKKIVNSPGIALGGTLHLLMLLLLIHYGAGALYHAILLIIGGQILNGLLIIFIGLPVISFIMRIILAIVVNPITELLVKRLSKKYEEAMVLKKCGIGSAQKS